jgi:hypothetical protein
LKVGGFKLRVLKFGGSISKRVEVHEGFVKFPQKKYYINKYWYKNVYLRKVKK